MRNAYNTDDPRKLLELKRLEADALLDVLRTINDSELDISKLCLIARNVLRAQLGVKKVIFYYEINGNWVEGMRLGFETMELDGLEELIHFTKTTKVTPGFAPCLQKMGVEYVVPIIHRGEPSAYFVIADFADTEVETQNDLIFIATLGNIMNVAIRNRQLISEKVRQEFLKRELEVASTIQNQLLISDFSRFKEIDVFGLNVSHHGIGGDFYDVIKRGKGMTFVCIADVAGKGIGAALLMSNLQANLRALCAQYSSPMSIVKELNKIMFQITQGDRFVTLFLGRVMQEDQTFTYVNAGHNYPYYLKGDNFQELDKGCMLLGVMPEIGVEEEEIIYEPGDAVFMFTDGVTEQYNAEGEMFGSDKILEELKKTKDLSARQVVNHFRHELFAYSDGVETGDDITMLHAKFLP